MNGTFPTPARAIRAGRLNWKVTVAGGAWLEGNDALRLTLRAEPDENHDIGDHVNWYDVRLLLVP